jgi:hypothetical protein
VVVAIGLLFFHARRRTRRGRRASHFVSLRHAQDRPSARGVRPRAHRIVRRSFAHADCVVRRSRFHADTGGSHCTRIDLLLSTEGDVGRQRRSGDSTLARVRTRETSARPRRERLGDVEIRSGRIFWPVPMTCSSAASRVARMSRFGVRSGSVGRSLEGVIRHNQAVEANGRERVRTPAPSRQAGGHWFEPSTAHSTKALLDAELRRLRSKRLEANVREMSALNAARPSGVVSADNGASGLRITVVGVASRVLGNSAMCGEDGARVGASTRSNARNTRRAGNPTGPSDGS